MEHNIHQFARKTLGVVVAPSLLVRAYAVGVLDQKDELRMLVLLNQRGRVHYVLARVDCAIQMFEVVVLGTFEIGSSFVVPLL